MNYTRLVKLVAVLAMFGGIWLMAQSGKIVATGRFHGAAHSTSGRATVYSEENGAETLRLTRFKTSNGPNLHVLLIAATDAQDNEDFLKKGTERIDLGPLQGNEGDQNYTIPAGTDFSKYRAVSIFCERFSVNFGTAPLEK
jgi:hypothetical protein